MEKVVEFEDLKISHSKNLFSFEISQNYIAEKWRHAYIEACDKIQRTNNRINIFFSGGIDSAIPALCFYLLDCKNVNLCTYILTFENSIVNAYELENAVILAKKFNFPHVTIEHKLENLINDKLMAEMNLRYSLLHFEWAWQAYMIFTNPYKDKYYNIGCAGDLHTDSSNWYFDPMWSFSQRACIDSFTMGCQMFPLYNSKLFQSWLFDPTRIAIFNENSILDIAKSKFIKSQFPELDERKKIFVYKQSSAAESLITEYNSATYSKKHDSNVFKVSIDDIQKNILKENKYRLIQKTDYNLI